jgi:leucyl aminopeptidase
MKWTVVAGAAQMNPNDLLVLGMTRKKGVPSLGPWRDLDKTLGGALKAAVKADLFQAKAKETQSLLCGRTRVLMLGLGDHDELDLNGLRFAAAAAATVARGLKAVNCRLDLPWAELKAFKTGAVARVCVEGAEMALFDFGSSKVKTVTKDKPLPRSWKLSPPPADAAEFRRGLKSGEAYAAGSLLARDLVNRPANVLTPAKMVAEARALARKDGLKIQVHGEAWLRKNGYGGVLGVGQGSRMESRLIVLDYKPRGLPASAPSIFLVGKGVTFDTGGISLKPSPKMHEMKGDMGGAAASIGAALIIARLQMKAHVRVIVPVVENMPDGNAIRPGDVLNMASGKTVEVLNTDAEGRLILADALYMGGRDKPDYMIDTATLTGSCAIALGDHFAGLFGNNKPLADVIYQAGGDTFERVWHMPLLEDHHKELESDVADIKNIGGRNGGASSAAAFLEEFVPDGQPWAHLDIAGPGWTETAQLPGAKGASGYGARLLARTVEILAGRKD